MGFEVEAAKRGAGLGLVNMQERVHALHGQLRVESKPGAGARVIASVPVVAALEGSSTEVNDWRMAV